MNEKRELIISYIKANVDPILVDFISSEDLENTTIIPANLERNKLNGHYEGIEFFPPNWLNNIQ